MKKPKNKRLRRYPPDRVEHPRKKRLEFVESILLEQEFHEWYTTACAEALDDTLRYLVPFGWFENSDLFTVEDFPGLREEIQARESHSRDVLSSRVFHEEALCSSISELEVEQRNWCKSCLNCQYLERNKFSRKNADGSINYALISFCFCDYPKFGDFIPGRGQVKDDVVYLALREFGLCSIELDCSKNWDKPTTLQPFTEGTASVLLVDNYEDIEKSPRCIGISETSCCQFHK